MIAEEEPGAVDVHEGDEDHGEGAGCGVRVQLASLPRSSASNRTGVKTC